VIGGPSQTAGLCAWLLFSQPEVGNMHPIRHIMQKQTVTQKLFKKIYFEKKKLVFSLSWLICIYSQYNHLNWTSIIISFFN
jgi:hypothetical protein